MKKDGCFCQKKKQEQEKGETSRYSGVIARIRSHGGVDLTGAKKGLSWQGVPKAFGSLSSPGRHDRGIVDIGVDVDLFRRWLR